MGPSSDRIGLDSPGNWQATSACVFACVFLDSAHMSWLSLIYPVEGTSHRVLPESVHLISFTLVDGGRPGLVRGPSCPQILDLFEKTNRQTGRIGCAKSGRLQNSRPCHAQVQLISLELHEQFVSNHSTVHPERRELYARVLLHSFQDFACLESRCFQCGTRQVALVRIPCQSDDHATSVVPPIGSIEPGKCGDEIYATIVPFRTRQ